MNCSWSVKWVINLDMEPQPQKKDDSSDEEVASEVIEDLFNDATFYKPEPLDTFDVYERRFDHNDGKR